MPQGLAEMWAINFPFVRNVVTYESGGNTELESQVIET
jgi:hypothetical protein